MPPGQTRILILCVASGFVDLSVNRPATTGYLEALARLMPQLPNDRRYPALQDFHAPEGPVWARDTIASWLAPVTGIDVPAQIIMTNGAQHGLACTLGAIARPGDTILADCVTYQGIGALCRSLDLIVKPVMTDQDGMLPDALAAMCAANRPRALLIVPTLHNPTTVTLSAERRNAIADVARAHETLIIEDDVYRPLKGDALPAFITMSPEITVYISSFSKCVAPGLRVGAVLAPKRMVADIAAMLRINCWSISPLNALVAVRMIEDGSIERIISGQRDEFALRQTIVRETLGAFDVVTDDAAPHAWLNLPEPWQGNAFARVASQNGVGILPGEAFAIDRTLIPHAVRINLGAARSREDLRRALETLRKILSGDRRVFEAVV